MRNLLIVAALGSACSPEARQPAAPAVTITTTTETEAAGVEHAPAPPSPRPVACPLAAMRLVSQPPDGPEAVMVTLDEQGRVEGMPELAALNQRDPGIATFDERGCLYGAEGVVSELTRDGDLWMMRGVLQAPGRTVDNLFIATDGRITSSTGDAGHLRLEGFEERGLCAGKLLVGAMFAIFAGASMAVVDGVADVTPPPADSVCPERHGSP